MWPLRLDVFISKGRHSSTFYWISQDEGFEWRSTLHRGNLYLAWNDGWVKDSGANKWRWGWTCPFGGEVVWGELSMMQISRMNFDIMSYESLNCDQLGAILAGFLLFGFFCIIPGSQQYHLYSGSAHQVPSQYIWRRKKGNIPHGTNFLSCSFFLRQCKGYASFTTNEFFLNVFFICWDFRSFLTQHAIQGRSFYSPAVLKLKCGYSITHQQGTYTCFSVVQFSHFGKCLKRPSPCNGRLNVLPIFFSINEDTVLVFPALAITRFPFSEITFGRSFP